MNAGDARRRASHAVQIAVLLQLSESLAEAVTPRDVTETVVRVAGDHLDPAFVGVGLVNQQRGTLHYSDLPVSGELEARWSDIPLSLPSPGTDAARTGETVVFASLPDAVARYPEAAELIEAAGLASRIATPLRTAHGILGSLVMGWVEPDRVREEDRALVMALARYVALSMERALMFEERQSVAEVLQQALLTRLPQVEGAELAARYQPAALSERVGGDWYDALVRADGTVCLMIGDVCGHDIDAAAGMGQLRGMLRSMAYDAWGDPADVLTRLDRSAGPLGVDRVATASLVQISPPDAEGSRDVAWSSAGHPPPVVIDAGGQVYVWDEPGDLVLGVRPSMDRQAWRARLHAGSTLLLYTDGLVERRDRSVAAGVAELVALLGARGALSLPALLDLVVAELAGERPQDDVALVALRLDRAD